jgi:hypothetical protein
MSGVTPYTLDPDNADRLWKSHCGCSHELVRGFAAIEKARGRTRELFYYLAVSVENTSLSC